ncbi:MAG TPA: sulfotransferase [Chthonomonadales bacterium]|nr:sulfotransferase [Chthonomonadales bacterium]
MVCSGVKVLYIYAHARSGSTLLDRMLGQADGYISTGEMRHIWTDGFRDNYLCGCERQFQSCEFWQAVVKAAFPDPATVDHAKLAALGLDLEKRSLLARRLPQMAMGRMTKRLRDHFQPLVDHTAPIYQAIHDVSGGQVIVDSSKTPAYALMLKHIPGIEMHVVHLVRDSRAVAFSSQRKKKRPEIQSADTFMATVTPRQSALTWIACNGIGHGLSRAFGSYTVIRYEDLVSEPVRTLTAIMRAVSEPVPALDYVSQGELRLTPAHTVAGNPMRFQSGTLSLRTDAEWMQKMNARQRRLVTSLSSPLLARYGYLSSRPRRLTVDSSQPVGS